MERPEAKEKTLSEKLFDDRILFLLGEVDADNAANLVMSMLYLESLAPKDDIFLFIDSPGGSITAGLSIIDTMRFIQCPIWTVCIGMAASMGALILSAGTEGKRIGFPNSRMMIHQPLQYFQGVQQATQIQIQAREIMRLRERLNKLLAKTTKQSVERINEDTERDYWLFAEEALEYGLIDCITQNRQDLSRIAKQLKPEGSSDEV